LIFPEMGSVSIFCSAAAPSDSRIRYHCGRGVLVDGWHRAREPSNRDSLAFPSPAVRVTWCLYPSSPQRRGARRLKNGALPRPHHASGPSRMTDRAIIRSRI
jgi:hypothetical protein